MSHNLYIWKFDIEEENWSDISGSKQTTDDLYLGKVSPFCSKQRIN
ncbi:protein of unknown function [Shewanella benthica]|uniref:Uncharacterized protein n=1 Tax=Shewanella benthica TaxID=43661 RepID=A0A330M0M3_9GAMM|nr:protein of unknown function [Shewanella benthica]